MNKLTRIWKDKFRILRAFFHTLFQSKEVKELAEKRKKICKSNECGFYDEKGSGPNAFIKGKPACGICGCNINLLTHDPESTCSLTEHNKKPLWKSNQW